MKVLVILLFLSVKAFAISADKCQSTDWFAVGRDSGFKAEPEEKVLKIQKDCQKKGVEMSIDQYKKGWMAGISQYCSHDNAYQLGFKRKSASKNCPVEFKNDFDQFYAWGKDAFKLEKELKGKESKLKAKAKALNSIEKKKESLEKEVKKLEGQVKELNSKIDGIESEMKSKRSVIKKVK